MERREGERETKREEERESAQWHRMQRHTNECGSAGETEFYQASCTLSFLSSFTHTRSLPPARANAHMHMPALSTQVEQHSD